jgi:DNA ligase-1
MKAFVELFAALDETTKTNEKVEAMVAYLRHVPPQDAAWAIYFLSGRKPKAVMTVTKLSEWTIEAAPIPSWLFDECYDTVGDIAETIALVLPPSGPGASRPLHEVIERLYSLRAAAQDKQKSIVVDAWMHMKSSERFVFNKLLTGAFRVGVSQQLVARAISEVSGLTVDVINHRLMGNWEPGEAFYSTLINPETEDSDVSRPYPFCLAYALDSDPEKLGDVHTWCAEWKWDGIRAQLIKRSDQVFLWSRGEELVTERFPEIVEAARSLPDGTVIDGEILPWRNGVLDFGELQPRIGRKMVSRKLMQDIPVVLMAYDLLEYEGEDVRNQPLFWRRMVLEKVVANKIAAAKIMLSPTVAGNSWQELADARLESRKHNVEGLVLKRLSSTYKVGRQRGDWWKWKVDPYTVDAVLLYAQPGSGKRASLYTDYTFGVWSGDQLVPFAKAYSGLTDAEIRKVDAFIRENTLERHGPVRVVKPQLVFELGFEGIQRSKRHKSGIAVRFPRILRWRHDKKAEEADALTQVEALLDSSDRRI